MYFYTFVYKRLIIQIRKQQVSKVTKQKIERDLDSGVSRFLKRIYQSSSTHSRIHAA